MCKDLKFALLNVQGLATECTNKLESEEIKNLFSNNYIIMFTEHWGCSFTNFAVNGFTYFELNRTEIKQKSKRSSGGIVIYIKNSLIKQNKNTELSIRKQDDDIMWLTLSSDYFWVDCNLHICLCYIISEHCTLLFSLTCNFLRSGEKSNTSGDRSSKINSKYVWDRALQNEYMSNLSSEEILNKLNKVTDKMASECNSSDIDETLTHFVCALDGVCKPLFERKVHCGQSKTMDTKYDETCELNKVLFLENHNNYRKDISELTEKTWYKQGQSLKIP